MSYQAIEDLLPKAGGSVYRLVRMASNRALELADGKPCLITNPSSDKATTTALEEIAQGVIESAEGARLREAIEKAEAKQEEE